MKKSYFGAAAGAVAFAAFFSVHPRLTSVPVWETANPVKPIPAPPLGIESKLTDLSPAPTPASVRLGRWLFFDARLSADGKVSCASCHKPELAFSELTPVSTGIAGQKGKRKSPSFVNAAWTIYPHFFWDGRADTLEEQVLGPIENPIEMGNSHEKMVLTLAGIGSYKKYFKEAFGAGVITKELVARAIADYERTRMSGNSAWDRWKHGKSAAVSEEVRRGDALFFDRAGCNQCHFGQNFTDTSFHNLGVGWDAAKKTFADRGRYEVTKKEADLGAFKTPTLRDISRHPPYMHDGSVPTLEQAVQHYVKGGIANPHLDPKMQKLDLSAQDANDLVAFLKALDGEGFQDTPPAAFPQ
jgi:cytochrome c peroxidase